MAKPENGKTDPQPSASLVPEEVRALRDTVERINASMAPEQYREIVTLRMIPVPGVARDHFVVGSKPVVGVQFPVKAIRDHPLGFELVFLGGKGPNSGPGHPVIIPFSGVAWLVPVIPDEGMKAD